MKLECKTVRDWVYVVDIDTDRNIGRFEQLSEAVEAIRLVSRVKSILFVEVENLLKSILDCPYVIDSATVPKAGIEIAPEQVAGNLSIAYLKIKRIEEFLNKIRGSADNKQNEVDPKPRGKIGSIACHNV